MTKKLRSQAWFGGHDRDSFIHRSWMKNHGEPADSFDGRPVIGICNTFSELTPCNAHFRELAERVKAAEAVKRWCVEYPKGGTVKGNAAEVVTVEAEQSRRMLCEAEEILSVFAPRRARFLSEFAEYDRQAREIYPAMFTAGSADAERFQSLLEAFPEVKRFPDYALILGDWMTGFNVRNCGQWEASRK